MNEKIRPQKGPTTVKPVLAESSKGWLEQVQRPAFVLRSDAGGGSGKHHHPPDKSACRYIGRMPRYVGVDRRVAGALPVRHGRGLTNRPRLRLGQRLVSA